MDLKGLDLFHLSKLTSLQVDHITCLECCKYYIAPETAACGHSLCHACWRGRRTCPSCVAPLERRSLKLNLQLQNLTEHIHTLAEAFEKLFNIKLDEFILDETNDLKHEVESDPTKNVKDWLASSQNQFSAPLINSESFSQEINNPVELSTSKIQVHMNSKKSKSPQKVIYVPPPQDDWDKIEQLPDTDEGCINNKENLTNQTNKQPILIGDEYTTDNPRRSSRKREYNSQNESPSINQNNIPEKQSSKNSSSETEKKSSKAKQNWNNVKRMRKEFSKLNKKNRSKLNVSIEMCKKSQSTANKQNIETEQQKAINKDSQPIAYTIEDNTPDINANNNVEQIMSEAVPNEIISINNKNNDEKLVLESPNLFARINDETNQVINPNMCPKPNEIENTLQKSPLLKDAMSQNSVIKIDGHTNTIPYIENTEPCPNCSGRNQGININSNSKSSGNQDDIEITFKVGNTLTNITIKRKSNDVQLKVKTDREVQTSLGSNCLVNKHNNVFNVEQSNPQEIEINIDNNNSITATKIENKILKNIAELPMLNKSSSTKKNTASADTATVQFEITESVEKELSSVMECVEVVENNKIQSENKDNILNTAENCEDFINDLDIFDNESVREEQIQLLNKSKQAPSEILMPTVKTKSQKHRDKRDRDTNEDEEVPNAKKIKTTIENSEAENNGNDSTLQQSHKDNESINYDMVMGQVFASIDADIEKSQQSTKNNPPDNKKSELMQKSQCTDNILQIQNSKQESSISTQKVTKGKECVNEKYSENIFSIVEKDEETVDSAKKDKDNHGIGSTQQHIDNLLTPGMCQDLISTHEANMEINKEHCTPFHENDDSDKSVVEETPQKNVSFPKPKNVSDVSIVTNQLQRVNSGVPKVAPSSQLVKSVINVSDTLVDTTRNSKDHADLETNAKKPTLETPLTINKFVDQIKHKSTPVARKSLNFDSENIDDIDPEQTLCPSSLVAKTTQEKEFMTKAFEQTPKSPVKKPLMTRNHKEVNLKYCIAGSCLSAVELTNVKFLCRKYNWKYVDKYTRELTHLVVGVDEDNRSQRSVKYMCALAASKWIVSYDWVDACINTNIVVGEILFEALDGTGEPGPKRSRLAKTKLFQGITFYCMPPFSVLDVGALKEMLEAAGGRVVDEVKAVRAVSDAPALLLAEPEHTQEDRFMYLALELNIVPVNYEWVLNCLGSYALSSIHELLMCPAALLPPATAQWPEELMARDTD